MKGATIAVLAAAFLVPAASLAQTHGVPASVTSISRWSQTPGVPASVTSIGPRGYAGGQGGVVLNPGGCGPNPALIPSAMGCNTERIFYPSVNYRTGQVEFRTHNTHVRSPRGWNGPVVYPYPVYTYPVMQYSDYTQPEEEVAPPPPQPAQPVEVHIVVEDKRAEQPEAVPQEQLAPPPVSAAAPAPQKPPTVLVYRDGHREEVQNYAIVGQTLYDLGTFVAHKIPLASLDLKQTVKANEDLGLDFTLPAGYKME